MIKKHILFLGFGLNINRREAVSVNTLRMMETTNELGIKTSLISIGYLGGDYGSSMIDSLIRRQEIIEKIKSYIVNNKVTHVVDVFVLPLSSHIFIRPLLKSVKKVVFIKEIHNNFGYSKHLTFESLIRYIANRKSQLQAIMNTYDSCYTRNPSLAKIYKVTYLPTNIDISTLKRSKSNKIRISYLGHPLKKKGIYTFPSLFAELTSAQKKRYRFSFALSDIGPRDKVKKMLEKSAKKYGVDIAVMGKVTPSEFFRDQDIYVLPIQDVYGAVSTPNTILEAMESRCVVIATDISSLVGILRHRSNAVLVKNPSAKKLIKAIVGLSRGKLREKLANQARKDIIKYYTKRSVISALERIYGI